MSYNYIGGIVALFLAFLLLYGEYRIKRFEIRGWFHALNMIPCKCGCKDGHWNVKATDAGFVSEAEVVCDKCGKIVNYWAYGNLEYPETYTTLIVFKIHMLRDYFNLKQRYKNWVFSRSVKRNPRGF